MKMEIKTDLPQMLKQWGEKIVMKLPGSVWVLPVELSCLLNRLLELAEPGVGVGSTLIVLVQGNDLTEEGFFQK